MKTRWIKVLFFPLIVGILAGSISSLAAETDQLDKQDIKNVDVADDVDKSEKSENIKSEAKESYEEAISADEVSGTEVENSEEAGDAIIDKEKIEDKNSEKTEIPEERVGVVDNYVIPNGWSLENGKNYWYEDGVRQCNREIYDYDAHAWYLLDKDGAMVVSQDVYLEAGSRWVRYGNDGRRIEGEDCLEGAHYYFETVTGTMIKGPWILPDGRKVFYDIVTGQMVKGEYEVNGVEYHFDETDGHLLEEVEDVCFWLTIDNNTYLYKSWARQGWKPDMSDYCGEEVYDSATNAYYWLDGLQQGKMATNMDVYQEAQADDTGSIGKWVRYGEDGRRISGWTEDGMYYFDPVYGTRAQGTVVIDDVQYEFDQNTGERIEKYGFEAYGIVCNVIPGESYVYKAATFEDSSITTEGIATFDYRTFSSDDMHTEKEGYIWKQAVISLTFGDVNAQAYGCRVNTLFGLDYYTFDNAVISEPSPESMVESRMTVLLNGVEYPITAKYELLRNERKDDGGYYMEICVEYHVPIEYNGMTVVLYHAQNVERGNHEMNRIDENSLIFRME